MKHLITALIGTVVLAASGYAGAVEIEVRLATALNGESVTSFAPDTAKLFALCKTKGLQKGDELRGVWIADDVGEAAPKETRMDEKTLDADADMSNGVYSLSRPDNGWPPGSYRLEIYVDDALTKTVNFTIGKDAADAGNPKEAKPSDE